MAEAPADTKKDLFPRANFTASGSPSGGLQLSDDGLYKIAGKTFIAGKDSIPVLEQNKELYDKLFGKTLTLHSSLRLQPGEEIQTELTERNLNFYAKGVLLAQFPVKGNYNLVNDVDARGRVLENVVKREWTAEEQLRNPNDPQKQPWYEREYVEIDPRAGKELVDKTDLGAFPKDRLLGKEFLYRETVTAINSDSNFLAVGYTTFANVNVSTVKFKFTDDELGGTLVAFPVKEYTNNSALKEEIIRFEVETFDVVLRKDSTG